MKIIKKLLQAVKKPGPSRRNPRKTISWPESQRELLYLFDFEDWSYRVPVTWLEVA